MFFLSFPFCALNLTNDNSNDGDDERESENNKESPETVHGVGHVNRKHDPCEHSHESVQKEKGAQDLGCENAGYVKPPDKTTLT